MIYFQVLSVGQTLLVHVIISFSMLLSLLTLGFELAFHKCQDKMVSRDCLETPDPKVMRIVLRGK